MTFVVRLESVSFRDRLSKIIGTNNSSAGSYTLSTELDGKSNVSDVHKSIHSNKLTFVYNNPLGLKKRKTVLSSEYKCPVFIAVHLTDRLDVIPIVGHENLVKTLVKEILDDCESSSIISGDSRASREFIGKNNAMFMVNLIDQNVAIVNKRRQCSFIEVGLLLKLYDRSFSSILMSLCILAPARDVFLYKLDFFNVDIDSCPIGGISWNGERHFIFKKISEMCTNNDSFTLLNGPVQHNLLTNYEFDQMINVHTDNSNIVQIPSKIFTDKSVVDRPTHGTFFASSNCKTGWTRRCVESLTLAAPLRSESRTLSDYDKPFIFVDGVFGALGIIVSARITFYDVRNDIFKVFLFGKKDDDDNSTTYSTNMHFKSTRTENLTKSLVLSLYSIVCSQKSDQYDCVIVPRSFEEKSFTFVEQCGWLQEIFMESNFDEYLLFSHTPITCTVCRVQYANIFDSVNVNAHVVQRLGWTQWLMDVRQCVKFSIDAVKRWSTNMSNASLIVPEPFEFLNHAFGGKTLLQYFLANLYNIESFGNSIINVRWNDRKKPTTPNEKLAIVHCLTRLFDPKFVCDAFYNAENRKNNLTFFTLPAPPPQRNMGDVFAEKSNVLDHHLAGYVVCDDTFTLTSVENLSASLKEFLISNFFKFGDVRDSVCLFTHNKSDRTSDWIFSNSEIRKLFHFVNIGAAIDDCNRLYSVLFKASPPPPPSQDETTTTSYYFVYRKKSSGEEEYTGHVSFYDLVENVLGAAAEINHQNSVKQYLWDTCINLGHTTPFDVIYKLMEKLTMALFLFLTLCPELRTAPPNDILCHITTNDEVKLTGTMELLADQRFIVSNIQPSHFKVPQCHEIWSSLVIKYGGGDDDDDLRPSTIEIRLRHDKITSFITSLPSIDKPIPTTLCEQTTTTKVNEKCEVNVKMWSKRWTRAGMFVVLCENGRVITTFDDCNHQTLKSILIALKNSQVNTIVPPSQFFISKKDDQLSKKDVRPTLNKLVSKMKINGNLQVNINFDYIFLNLFVEMYNKRQTIQPNRPDALSVDNFIALEKFTMFSDFIQSDNDDSGTGLTSIQNKTMYNMNKFSRLMCGDNFQLAARISADIVETLMSTKNNNHSISVLSFKENYKTFMTCREDTRTLLDFVSWFTIHRLEICWLCLSFSYWTRTLILHKLEDALFEYVYKLYASILEVHGELNDKLVERELIKLVSMSSQNV